LLVFTIGAAALALARLISTTLVAGVGCVLLAGITLPWPPEGQRGPLPALRKAKADAALRRTPKPRECRCRVGAVAEKIHPLKI